MTRAILRISLLLLAASACSRYGNEAPANGAAEDAVRAAAPALTASIHPDLPDYTFTLRGERQDDPDGTIRVEGIEIRRGGEEEPVQIIDGLDAELPFGEKAGRIEVLDMNFDGYGDLRVVEFLPAGPNVPYINWLFDPASAHFVRAMEFDEVLSPQFDSETRRIRSDWRDGATRYGTDVYTVVDGKPALVRREIKEYSAPGAYELTVKERVDGGWETVEKRMVED